MPTKQLRAGGEIDSWCTKCNLLLNHRIVAIKDGVPARVECLTCRGEHKYRAHAPGEKPATSKSASGSTRSSSSGTRSKSAAAAAAEKAEANRAKVWEKAIAGRAMSDFRSYRVNEAFQEGELVRHSRFGDGVVTRIVDPRKIEVLFKDDAKTLAQNLVD